MEKDPASSAKVKPEADAASSQPESDVVADVEEAEEPETPISVITPQPIHEWGKPDGLLLPKDEPRLQLYTPSSLFDLGQFEVKFFQQLYSQTRFWNGEGNAVDQGNRSNYYSGIGNVLFGINKRINLGVDFWIQSVYIDPEEKSPFRLFTFPGAPNGRTALTAIGPKVKFQPFPGLNGFTVQSSFLFPTASDPEGRSNGLPYLATENYLSWTQIFYTHNFSSRFQLFTELDLYWNINRGEGNGFFATPASVFLSYFPTKKITVYVMNQFWPTWGGSFFSSYWYQAGIGGKVQLGRSLDLELSYGRFLVGRNAAGPAQAFNLGLRFVKW
jgi:hypothetical protein